MLVYVSYSPRILERALMDKIPLEIKKIIDFNKSETLATFNLFSLVALLYRGVVMIVMTQTLPIIESIN